MLRSYLNVAIENVTLQFVYSIEWLALISNSMALAGV